MTDHGPDSSAPAQVAIVTGAASGIGRATVRRLLDEGYRVGGLDIDGAGLRVLAAEAGVGDRLTVATMDVADTGAVPAAMTALARDLGPVFALVNVAGIGGSGAFLDTDPAAWERVLGVHLGGTVACTRAVLPAMLDRGSGRIVNLLTDGLWHGRTTVAYTTAKGAILGFTRALAVEVADRGVRVNAVAPGPVATPMLLDGDPEEVAAELRTVPLRRALQPDEVAATISFLLGPGGEPYVGQVLGPNGGTVFAG